EGPLILVGGGSGMSPLWSIFQDHVESGEKRAVRFFYGARTQADLFYLDEIKELGAKLDDFAFIPVLSDAADDDDWSGEKGMVHEVLQRHLAELDLSDGGDAYTCGPPPMIDAVMPMLIMSDIEGDHIFFDKFTQASG
ncbi:MAG: CDP-6-deoxy-delta-3,4-glucoseen reductase, partial [Geminicoccales bacterium]